MVTSPNTIQVRISDITITSIIERLFRNLDVRDYDQLLNIVADTYRYGCRYLDNIPKRLNRRELSERPFLETFMQEINMQISKAIYDKIVKLDTQCTVRYRLDYATSLSEAFETMTLERLRNTIKIYPPNIDEDKFRVNLWCILDYADKCLSGRR